MLMHVIMFWFLNLPFSNLCLHSPIYYKVPLFGMTVSIFEGFQISEVLFCLCLQNLKELE